MPGDTEKEIIERNREEIDRIDGELLRMLNQRAACAIAIGKIKKKKNLPIHVPEREENVLQRLTSLNEGPIPAQAVRNVFETIFAQMRDLENIVDEEP